MLKTLIYIFKSMILINQKKRITSVSVEILLQDQGPQIIKNKRRRGQKSLLKGIARMVICGMVFLNADDTFGLDSCVDLIHLIQKVEPHYKSQSVIR